MPKPIFYVNWSRVRASLRRLHESTLLLLYVDHMKADLPSSDLALLEIERELTVRALRDFTGTN